MKYSSASSLNRKFKGWILAAAWSVREASPEAGGLPFVYLLKSTLLLMPALLILQGCVIILTSALILQGKPVLAEHDKVREL